jgi:hypothetical protein
VNSNEKYNSTIISNIIKKFAIYETHSNDNQNVTNINKVENDYDGDGQIIIKENPECEEKKPKIQEDNTKIDNTKACLETLFKIIDVGLDKSYEDFMQDITMIAQPLTSLDDYSMKTYQLEQTPITEYRYFLKPQQYKKKKLIPAVGGKASDDDFDLYDLYKNNLSFIMDNYFSHLKNNEGEDKANNEDKRIRLYKSYRVKIVLVEEKDAISNFIENMHNTIYSRNSDKISDDRAFWSMFVKNNEDVEIKFLVYLVPNYEYSKDHPFKILGKNENAEIRKDHNNKNQNLLSEFIANNDNIYKNVIFIPWSAPRDTELTEILRPIDQPENILNNSDSKFKTPNADVVYSFLKEPLDLYLSDARGLFNLNLYQCKIIKNHNDLFKEKILWKSAEISMDHSSSKGGGNDTKIKKETLGSTCTIT